MSKIIQLIEQYAEAREDGAECCNSVEAFNIQTSFEALCSEVARLEQSHAELLQALKESRRLVADARDAFGPCDHSVGICNCDMDASIAASDDAIKNAEAV